MSQSTKAENPEGDVASEYRSVARNFSAESENRIHDQDVAQRFGFEGGLVPGAAVFGHMAQSADRGAGRGLGVWAPGRGAVLEAGLRRR